MEGTGGDVANLARLERDDIVHRKNAALLSDGEAAGLRSAFEQVKEISAVARGDNRGFFEHAGQHGVPYWACPHHTPQRIFLPWHRAYLYRLEQSLQDRVGGVTIPWWDWTTARAIPPAFDAAEVGGQPNALFSARTLVTPADVRDDAPVVEETFRDPGHRTSCPRPTTCRRSSTSRASLSSPMPARTSTTASTAGSAGRWATSATPRSTRSSGRTTA